MLGSFTLIEALLPDVRQEDEGLLARRLKAINVKDKTKSNKGTWLLKFKKPDQVNNDTMELNVKKVGPNNRCAKSASAMAMTTHPCPDCAMDVQPSATITP